MVCGGRAAGWTEVILEIDDREGWASLDNAAMWQAATRCCNTSSSCVCVHDQYACVRESGDVCVCVWRVCVRCCEEKVCLCV